VADKGNTLELAIQVATAIKGSPIEGVFESVVMDETDHRHCVNWALAQKLDNFGFLALLERLGFHEFRESCKSM
jgi:hypothetical protein